MSGKIFLPKQRLTTLFPTNLCSLKTFAKLKIISPKWRYRSLKDGIITIKKSRI
jgi:hypothetical protein